MLLSTLFETVYDFDITLTGETLLLDSIKQNRIEHLLIKHNVIEVREFGDPKKNQIDSCVFKIQLCASSFNTFFPSYLVKTLVLRNVF